MRSFVVPGLQLLVLALLAGCSGEAAHYSAPILERVVIPFLAAFALALVPVVATVVAVQVKRRLGIEIDARQLEVGQNIARDAIARAEAWALQQARSLPEGAPPPGAEKLTKALEYFVREADRLKIPVRARDELVEFIEAQLGRWELFDEGARLDAGRR